MWVQTQSCCPVLPQPCASAAQMPMDKRLLRGFKKDSVLQLLGLLFIIFKQRVKLLLSSLILKLLSSRKLALFVPVPQDAETARGHLGPGREGQSQIGKGGGAGHQRCSQRGVDSRVEGAGWGEQ